MIFEGRLSHTNLLLDVTSCIESPINNLEWNSVQTFFFSTIPLYWLVHICVLQKFIVKSGCIFIEKNYKNIFKIKLLMYNQFQIFDFISFIICYKYPKKGHSTKFGIMTPKVSHFVHSPLTWPLLFLLKLSWMAINKIFIAFNLE
jgi:hypothetical protein